MKNFADKESLKILCEERNEDEANHGEERDKHGLPVTNMVHNNTRSIQAQDFTDLGTVGETILPSGIDLLTVSVMIDYWQRYVRA